MGTPDFAVPSLDILLRHGYEICAVVTGPDKPRGRGQEMVPSPVKKAGARHSLPLLQPVSLRDPLFAARLREFSPDLAVVVAFRILPPEVFTLPRLGSFNLHGSLLPKYRGAAPIQRALMAGESETGVTTFFLEEKVDTGMMILQLHVPIGPDEDFGSLHDRLAHIGAEAVLETVRRIEEGTAHPVAQNDAAATPAPKITKEDCAIDWRKPAQVVVNQVRALSPLPGAVTVHRETVLKIFRAVASNDAGLAPGEVKVAPESLHVGVPAGSVAITELQQPGRKRMGVAEFLRGYRIASGDRFGT